MPNKDYLRESFDTFIDHLEDDLSGITGGGGVKETLSNWWSGKTSECLEVCNGETTSMTDYGNGNIYTSFDCAY